MPKRAHTEEQIVAVLRQGEAGEKVADICRKVGISEGTYYLWKKQFAGLGSMSCESCGNCERRTGAWALPPLPARLPKRDSFRQHHASQVFLVE